MPWNSGYFPNSMKNLPPQVRAKSIAIANALLEQGYSEGMAIRIAIAQAYRWAASHAVADTAMRTPARHWP